MKTIKFCLQAIVLIGMVTSCSDDTYTTISEQKSIGNEPKAIYETAYTQQQLANWEKTGSPYLENELDNSSNTLIDPTLASTAGVFKPLLPESQTRAFGVNPEQNRFWSMIRLIIGNVEDYDEAPLRSCVIKAISEIEKHTNIRFYNAIDDPVTDPNYGFVYPNVRIQMAPLGQFGSSYVGRIGGEQYINIPWDMKNNFSKYNTKGVVGFIMHALCNAAGMYNEQQRYDRDTFINIYYNNIQSANKFHFDKITQNYFARGSFDWNSITLASSYDFSVNGAMTISDKSNNELPINTELSNLDRMFLNYFYLPYKARTDAYRELDDVVYDGNNRELTPSEIQELERYLNNGAYKPSTGEMIQKPW